MRRTSTPAISGFPTHFVVDGSNIATEGRSAPSLHQLNEAVLAFMEEHPGVLITVVVDATFGHRIDKKEVKEFDLAVANNELVTPPAGAVGRGDAFVLSIANKAKAGILSNDSFQEFHGQYDWLFEPARLIGGKPVPHVGWVFVERTPVRGPKSRAAVKDAKRAENGEAPAAPSGRRPRRGSSSGSPLANEPLPVPTTPPPGRPAAPEPAPAEAAVTPAPAVAPAPPSSKSPVNDLVPFLDFVERHPVGTSCSAVIESYSSHGAYARSDSVLVYIPLRLMDDPAPRSARSVLKLGEAVALVVVGYAPERRSIDCALPNMAPAAAAAPAPTAEAQLAKRPRRGSKAAKAEQAEETAAITAAAVAAAEEAAPTTADAAEPAPAKPSRRRGSKAAPAEAQAAPEVVTESRAEQPGDGGPAPAKRSRSTRAAKAAAKPAETTAAPEAAPAAKKAPAKKTAAKATKAAAKKTADAPATSEAPVKKAAAKKTPAKKTPAKKTPAKKAAAG